jgi:hypothetical protein
LLELDPPYQRRSVWNQRYREDFIETVLLGYPAPSVFLYADMGDDGITRYAVVDGKQRLTTVLAFADDEFATRDEADAALSEELRGKYLRDMSSDQRKEFWSYEFAVEYIPSTEEALLNEVFDRINRNVARLTRQELRHARYEGVFATAIDEIAVEMAPLFNRSFPRIVDSSRRQMKDVEFAASLAILVEAGPEATTQDEFDRLYGERDEDWEGGAGVRAALSEDLAFITLLIDALPDLASTRLRNQGDFYALVGAVDALRRDERLPRDVAAAARRVHDFALSVSDDAALQEPENANVRRYYEAARSAANDTRQRLTRIEVLKEYLGDRG